jgi:hypothetical protein
VEELMEALKLLPQSFFDFLARLVPGALGLAIILDTPFGRERWGQLLNTLAAGRLSENNVTTLVLITATVATYVGGQLAAPFGKAMQRIAEAIEAIPSPPNGSPSPPQAETPQLPTRWTRITTALWPRPKTQPKPDKDTYDWLRVNAPEIGALVAKIRAEQTMFYSMSAVLLAAAVGELVCHSWLKAAGYAVVGLASELRGFTVGRTLKQTSQKLRRAVEDRFKRSAVGSYLVPGGEMAAGSGIGGAEK